MMLFSFMMQRSVCGLLLFVVASVGGAQPTAAPPFQREEYPAPAFQVAQRETRHGNAYLQLVQVKGLGEPRPFLCRAWLRVSVGDETRFSRYFADIEAAGPPYGLVIAEGVGPYVAVVKNGGADGRLYLIDEDGVGTDVPGGRFLISPDGRYLFSQSLSAAGLLRVIDLRNRAVVFASDQMPDVDVWYRTGGSVFFTVPPSPETRSASTQPKIAYWYDFNHHRFDRKETSSEVIRTAREWYYDFVPGDFEDCSGREYP